MKKFLCVIIVVLYCSLLLSCGTNEKEDNPPIVEQNLPIYEKFDEQDMQNKTLPDFGEILNYGGLMPQTTGAEHTVDEVAKIIYGSHYNMEEDEQIAINLADKKLFISPHYKFYDHTSEADYQMSEHDVQFVQDLIEQYNVLSWEYGFHGEVHHPDDLVDGGGWGLTLQFTDATISWSADDSPKYENQQEFVGKLVEFCRSKERNILQTFEQMALEARRYVKPIYVEQKIEDITKIYYYEIRLNDEKNSIYVDVKDNYLLRYGPTDVFLPIEDYYNYKMTESESNEFVDIVEKYNVLSWEGHHSEYAENGIRPYKGWVLILQFENCSLHVASGDTVNQEGQAEFVKEMRDLIMSKTPNVEIFKQLGILE